MLWTKLFPPAAFSDSGIENLSFWSHPLVARTSVQSHFCHTSSQAFYHFPLSLLLSRPSQHSFLLWFFLKPPKLLASSSETWLFPRRMLRKCLITWHWSLSCLILPLGWTRIPWLSWSASKKSSLWAWQLVATVCRGFVRLSLHSELCFCLC